MTLIVLCGIFLILLSYGFFWTVDKEVSKDGPGYELVSHRGLSCELPENTIEAFLGAIKKGFKWIELDVICTKDGVLVCAHNFDMERETDSYGYINEMTLKQVNFQILHLTRLMLLQKKQLLNLNKLWQTSRK